MKSANGFNLLLVLLLGIDSQASESICNLILEDLNKMANHISELESAPGSSEAAMKALQSAYTRKVRDYERTTGLKYEPQKEISKSKKRLDEAIQKSRSQSEQVKLRLEPLQPERNIETYPEIDTRIVSKLSETGQFLVLATSNGGPIIVKDATTAETLAHMQGTPFYAEDISVSETKKSALLRSVNNHFLSIDFSKKGQVESKLLQAPPQMKIEKVHALLPDSNAALMTFSIDGDSRQFGLVRMENGFPLLWQVHERKILNEFIDPLGRWAYISTESGAKFLSLHSGLPVLELDRSLEVLNGPAYFSPNGRFAAITYATDSGRSGNLKQNGQNIINLPAAAGHTLAVFDLLNSKLIFAKFYPELVNGITFSAGHDNLAFFDGGRFHLLSDLNNSPKVDDKSIIGSSSKILDSKTQHLISLSKSSAVYVGYLKNPHTFAMDNTLTLKTLDGDPYQSLRLSGTVLQFSADRSHFLVKRQDNGVTHFSIVDFKEPDFE